MHKLLTFQFLLLAFLGMSQADQNIVSHQIDPCKSDQPGYCLLVSNGHVTITEKTCGVANIETKTPISKNTIFNAASLSKQIVAFGILLLEKDGKLSLKDSISEIFPNCPAYFSKITIDHLLSHSSGIPDQWSLLSLMGYDLTDYITNQMMLDHILAQEKSNFEAGTAFQYSHSNYTLLGKIIELKSGMKLNDYLSEKIFKPLGMSNSFILQTKADVRAETAKSYTTIDGSWTPVALNYFNYGSSNFMTTPNDLTKWNNCLLRNSIFPKSVFDNFNAITKYDNGEDIVAADLGEERIMGCRGQFFRSYKGVDFYSHGGSLGGFRSFIGRIPDKNLSIVLLGNDGNPNTYVNVLSLIDELLGLESEEKQIDGKSEIKSIHEYQHMDLTIYEGKYRNSELDLQWIITHENDKLYLDFRERGLKEMKHTSENKFELDLLERIRLEFVMSDAQKVNGIKVKTKGITNLYFSKEF